MRPLKRAHPLKPIRDAKLDDTRDRLLQAAAEIFAEKGFAATTVREICLRAPANLALINYYFGDKLELYKEVLEKAIRDEGPAQKIQAIGATPEEELRHTIRTMLDRAIEKNRHSSVRYRLMMQEFIHPSRATELVVELTLKPVYDRLRDLVGAILSRPSSDMQTRLAVHSIIGQVVHFAHANPAMSILWPQMTMTAAQRDLIATHIANVMLTHLRTIRS